MDRGTIDELRALNRRFYEARAEDFDARRTRPWRGSVRVLEVCRAHVQGRLRVLDVGAGNGRLVPALGEGFEYLGLDQSEALLAKARRRFGGRASVSFRSCDILEDGAWSGLEAFDLVAAFGVLHHIPGSDTRRALVTRMAHAARPGGIVALSAWRVSAIPRFSSRVLPWEAAPEIDQGALESGDFLLRFGEAEGPPRYCHEVSTEELETFTRPWLREIARFSEDGDLNVYAIYSVAS